MFGRGTNSDKVKRSICNVLMERGASISNVGDDSVATMLTIEELPLAMIVTVDRSSVDFRCMLAFKASDSMYREVLDFLNDMNNKLAFGSFMLDPESGNLFFKYGYIYADARPTPQLIKEIIDMVVDTASKADGELKGILPVDPSAAYDPMFG